MKLSVRLRLDGVMRALRLTLHGVAEEVETRVPPVRREDAASRVRAETRVSSEERESGR